MIDIKEAAAAVAANQKMTRRDALDIARFTLALTLIPTMLVGILSCI